MCWCFGTQFVSFCLTFLGKYEKWNECNEIRCIWNTSKWPISAQKQFSQRFWWIAHIILVYFIQFHYVNNFVNSFTRFSANFQTNINQIRSICWMFLAAIGTICLRMMLLLHLVYDYVLCRVSFFHSIFLRLRIMFILIVLFYSFQSGFVVSFRFAFIYSHFHYYTHI